MNYLKSILLIIIVSLLGGILQHSIVHTNLVMLYILVVVIISVRWGKWPSIVSALLSVLIFDFFFVPPQFSMTVADTQYLIAFVTLFVVAIVISSLTLKAKEQAEAAKNREAQTLALYNFSKDISKAIDIETLFGIAINDVCNTFEINAAIFIKDNKGIRIKTKSPGFVSNENDYLTLIRLLQNEKLADWHTTHIPESNTYYIPLKTTKEAFGILGVEFKDKKLSHTQEQYRLLEAFANQISFAIEHLKLSEEAQQANLLREAEKLHTAFLNSISHDLRTPLASISGSLSSVLKNPKLNETNKNSLIETAYGESVHLNQLVSDLLNMARVEAGALHINKNPTDIKDLIGSALKQMEKEFEDFDIKVDISDNLPEIEVDFLLMMKVLTNVLDNALKYSNVKKQVDIKTEITNNILEITISDYGIGVPNSDLKQIFDKFYRVKRPQNYEGTGLGLSVCKGIVEAHNGKIWASNREEGGTTIKIQLPLSSRAKND